MNILDPARNTLTRLTAPVRDADTPFMNPQFVFQPSPYNEEEVVWSGKASLHNPMMDHEGRVWMTHTIRAPQTPAFCREGSSHPSAQLFPVESSQRHLSVFDPTTGEFTLIDTCFGTHHLQIAEDTDNTVWASNPGSPVVGWLNMRRFDETGDEQRSQGWCPYILDANGNVAKTSTLNRTSRSIPLGIRELRAGATELSRNPVDGSIWVAQGYNVPGAIIRLSPGDEPADDLSSGSLRTPVQQSAVTPLAASPRGESTSIAMGSSGPLWRAVGTLLASTDGNARRSTGRRPPGSTVRKAGRFMKHPVRTSRASRTLVVRICCTTTGWTSSIPSGSARMCRLPRVPGPIRYWRFRPAGSSWSCASRILWGFPPVASMDESTIQKLVGRAVTLGELCHSRPLAY